MAWQKKNTVEHKEVIDMRQGMHIVPLVEPETGAEHKLQIMVGHDACPHCGHVTPKTNLGEIDAKALIEKEIKALNLSHSNIHAYAEKHRVPVRKSNLPPPIPQPVVRQYGKPVAKAAPK